LNSGLHTVRGVYSNRRDMAESADLPEPPGRFSITPEAEEPESAESNSEPAEAAAPPAELQLLLTRVSALASVWVRMAATQNSYDSRWQFAFLEVITGAPPESWAEESWEYGSAAFKSVEVAGFSVVEWFVKGEIEVGPATVSLKPQHDVRPDRKDSREIGMYEPLLWPSVIWTTQTQTPSGGTFYGELVANDAPAFLSFDQAATAFFHIPPRSNNRLDGQHIVFREQDMRARIKQLTVSAADLTVMVDGSELAGKRLTLGGQGGASQVLNEGMFGVSFLLAGGLEEGAWVALHDGPDLLDRRVVGSSWRPGADVEFEDEPAVRLEALISRGENATFEAKRELPGDDPDRVLKTVAAFANGGGGTLVFGVDNELQIIGLGDALNRNSIDRVTSLISDRVHPHVSFDTETITIRDAALLAVYVYSGSDAPYGIGTNEQKLTYYVRRSGNSIPARPEDLRNSVRARTPAPVDQSGGLL
jgi:hypothetical protein